MRRISTAFRARPASRLAVQAASIFAIWLLIALVTATQDYLRAITEGRQQTWGSAFAVTAALDGLWAALTPLIIWLAILFPLSADRFWRSILAHLGAGVVVATIHVALYVLLFWSAYQGDFDSRLDLFVHKFGGNIYINLLTYTVILGLVSAARAYRALKEEQIAGARLVGQLAQAEASALRAQLQPHFLFNTLNAVSALVRTDPLGAERLIARLGDLLRMSIEDVRSPETTLAKELAFTDAFLAIEQSRLGPRLRIERSIDGEALAVHVPSLILQPLVENAVRHGIAESIEGGTLGLRVERAGQELRLLVEDDGVGAREVKERVGLGITRARLQQRYGAAAAMIVETAEGAGFRVSIRIPL
jgi:two-component system LytT family sensor kinase